ncbi:MAG TPA: S41 family peptidase [Thermoanaerobaculia bacterium]|nr:S41 family peptidase [Thermoanaerobaculia bacterium]
MYRAKALFSWTALMAVIAGGTAAPSFAAQSPAGSAVRPIPSFAQPALSPDGSQIAFSSGGDIWTVRADGGAAYLLVSHPANETRPLFSPDGRHLAFLSSRTGNGDIYVLTFETGEVRRLTWDDDNDQLDAWSPDSKWLYFSSSTHDLGGMNDVYRVRLEGGTPMPVSADRYMNEFFAAPSPDGKQLAFNARSIAAGQWWRHGHSHIDRSEIWLRTADGRYQKIEGNAEGAGAGKDLWPMWSADARRVYFTSDRTGAENLWSRDVGAGGTTGTTGAARQLTQFRQGRLLWPTISRDGKTIVFERDLAIWRYDTATGQAKEVPINLQGAPADTAPEHQRLTNEMAEMALSPDGKKVAFVTRGDVFAASSKDGGNAARVTATAGGESQVTWAPDSKRIVYASDRDGEGTNLFLYDFAAGTETRLTEGSFHNHTPKFSPDGKLLAFQRGKQEIRLLDISDKAGKKPGPDRLLTTVRLDEPPVGSDRPWSWSPDSRWIALFVYGDRMFRNAVVVPVDPAQGKARQVSFVANTGGNAISWSPDGKFLLFDTSQRTEEGQIARVDLQPRTPKFREDQFRDLFKEETPPAVKTSPQSEPEEKAVSPAAPAEPASLTESAKDKDKDAKDKQDAKDEEKPEDKAKPEKVDIAFDGIRQRLTLLPVGLDVNSFVISPDGKWLAMAAVVANRDNLYVYSLDELAREPAVAKQLTSTPGGKSFLQFSPDSKEIYYLENGGLNAVAIESPSPRPVTVTAEMDVDFPNEKMQVFEQSWRYLRDNFVDPKMNGVDWDASRAWYGPRILGSRTPDEMRRIMSLMIGDLNASHLGFRPPAGDQVTSTGRLGLRFDPAEYESTGHLRITTLLPLGPVTVTGKVKEGDYLLAVDGKPVSAATNLDQLLDYKVGRQVTLTVAGTAAGANRREVPVRPVDAQTEKGLDYRRWVEANRAYVAKVSNGRLGYVHMPDMGYTSLLQLYQDLDTENMGREGVVVDVRHNNGGFVSAYTIDTLGRRGYVNMAYRDYPAAPSRALLGQRALERPTVLVTDQHSLSDSELLTEGYRALGLGKVVGEPTSGWIIYTTNIEMVDGSILRIPFIQITDLKGQDMELNPRPVDVPATRPVGEGLTDRDTQLDVAVRELLQQLDTRPASAVAGNRP